MSGTDGIGTVPAPHELVVSNSGFRRWSARIDSLSVERSAQGKRIRVVAKGEEAVVFDLTPHQVDHLVSLLLAS